MLSKAEELMANYPNLKYQFNDRMPEKLKGLCRGDVIYLNPNQSSEQLVGTLGEEIAHYLTTVGDITAQDTNEKRKQEQKARDLGATLVVSPADYIECFNQRLSTRWECAEYLGVTVETLDEATNAYATLNNGKLDYENYTIFFRADGIVEIVKWMA